MATGSDDLRWQLDRLVALGYPALAGLAEAEFRALASDLDPPGPWHVAEAGLPWVLVVAESLVAPRSAVPLMTLVGSSRAGVLDRNHGPDGLREYRPVDQIDQPAAPLYLLTDVQRGDEFRGVRPQDALPVILGRGRTPLTIAEGIAVVTQAPELLVTNHCFMLSGSRRGDRRVPALWISGGAPKLGWCWDGNPHDWLGVASAAGRVG
jgi:hypothetical protein